MSHALNVERTVVGESPAQAPALVVAANGRIDGSMPGSRLQV
jgi:hypothetical protein